MNDKDASIHQMNNPMELDSQVLNSQGGKWKKILPWFICLIAALFYSYEYLLRISPSVMTVELMTFYQINAATFGILTATYYYAYTPMQAVVGLLFDRYGARKLLTIACLICVLGSYLFGGTSSITLAAFGRFILGFGSAFAFVGVLKLATEWLPSNRLAMVTGFTSALGTVGGMTGTIIMTSMVSKFGWQETIYYSASIGLLCTVLIYFIVKDSPSVYQREKLDRNQKAALRVQTNNSFKKLFGDLFVILRSKQIWLNGIITCLLYLPTTVFAELWGKTYLEQVFGLSTQESAYAIAILFLGFAVGAPFSGLLSDSIQKRRLPILISSVGSFFLFTILIVAPELSVTAIYTVLFSLGICYSSHVISFAIGRELAPMEAAGSAIAVTNMICMLGGFLFQPMVGMILDYTVSPEEVRSVFIYTPWNYRVALSVISIGLFISIFLSMFLRETHCRVVENP